MSKNWIEKRIVSEIVMFVEPNRIFIRCPYVHYSECPAYRYVLETPLKLDAERTRNGLLIKPKYPLSPRVSNLVQSGLTMTCKECFAKKRMLERVLERKHQKVSER